MTTKTETMHGGEFLLSEGNNNISRENVTFASGTAAMVAGTVVGKITSGGKYKQYDQQASDGSQAAAGVLFADVDASLADTPGVIIARLAEVKEDALAWPAGSPTDITAGVADLLALNIIVRS